MINRIINFLLRELAAYDFYNGYENRIYSTYFDEYSRLYHESQQEIHNCDKWEDDL